MWVSQYIIRKDVVGANLRNPDWGRGGEPVLLEVYKNKDAYTAAQSVMTSVM